MNPVFGKKNERHNDRQIFHRKMAGSLRLWEIISASQYFSFKIFYFNFDYDDILYML